MALPPRSGRSRGVGKVLDMLKHSVPFRAAVLLAVVLAGCGDEDEPGALPTGDGLPPIGLGRFELWGKWDGTRLAHPFLI